MKVDKKELSKLIDGIGVSKSEISRLIGVDRSTLYRWVESGLLPEKAYVWLKMVRFEKDSRGLKTKKVVKPKFKHEELKVLADEIAEMDGVFIGKDSKWEVLENVSTSDLVTELKKRHPGSSVIIGNLKVID